jgi:hypothetical protein
MMAARGAAVAVAAPVITPATPCNTPRRNFEPASTEDAAARAVKIVREKWQVLDKFRRATPLVDIADDEGAENEEFDLNEEKGQIKTKPKQSPDPSAPFAAVPMVRSAPFATVPISLAASSSSLLAHGDDEAPLKAICIQHGLKPCAQDKATLAPNAHLCSSYLSMLELFVADNPYDAEAISHLLDKLAARGINGSDEDLFVADETYDAVALSHLLDKLADRDINGSDEDETKDDVMLRLVKYLEANVTAMNAALKND